MTEAHKPLLLVAVLAALWLGASAAVAAPPTCLTPLAADGHEPPCNPYAADAPWSMSHRNSYASGASPYPGPVPGEDITIQRGQFPTETPTILTISAPYPDGGRALWFSTVGVPDPKAVYKVDYETLEVLGRFDSAAADGEARKPTSSTSGVYGVLARGNRFVAVREQRFEVFTDAEEGVRTSGIKRIARFELPATALCRDTDRIVGTSLMYNGRLAFVTIQGIVGVVPIGARMTEANLRTASINGERCADPAVKDDELETVNNSISTDEKGGIYSVSTRAMYRFDFRDGRVVQRWRAPYERGVKTGSTLSAGSGSTPDVTGTDPGDDKFIVITDGQKLMHLVLFWRNRIPADWTPIAPGKDRRIACEFPVTFGDPAATQSASEQSVLTRGYASVIVNNVAAASEAFGAIPAGLPDGFNQAASQAFTPQAPGGAPKGVERIDWDPKTRTCHSVWGNPDVSIPNAVPTLSVASGLVYSTGIRDGIWGLQGLDFATGRDALWVPAGPTPFDNSFYSASTVGPDGTILQGTIQGLDKYRTAPKPPLRLVCKDVTAPSISLRRRSSHIGRRRLVLRGRVGDRACGKRARVRRVDVVVRRRARGHARRVARGRARLSRGGARFRFARRRALPAGRYRIVVKATDAVGRRSKPRARTLRAGGR